MQTQNVKWIHRLLASLKLEPYLSNQYGKILLPYTIQPVIDMLLAASPVQQLWHNADPGATGWMAMFSVPAGERWLVHGIHSARTLGSTATVTAYRFGSQQVSSATAASNIIKIFEHPFPVPGGRTIDVYVAAYAAGDTVGTWITVSKVPITDEVPY